MRLPVRKRPYWVRIAEGLSLGYRRNQTAGTWSMRVADGRGSRWIKKLADADDHDDNAMSFWQAQAKARQLWHGSAPDDGSKLQTVAEVLTAYAADLELRGAGSGDAKRVENHLPPTLATKLVAQLNARELKAWRNGLLKKGLAPGSITRYSKSFKAALNLCAAHDPARVTNSKAWAVGLAALPDSSRARNIVLTDDQVRRFVTAAYTVSTATGMLVELAAVTGARPVQLRRLTVADVQRDRLMMPSSRKGRGKKRIERRALPIPEALAARLRQLGKGRAPDVPLLLADDGEPWSQWGHSEPIRQAVEAAGLDEEVTIYALRHSSIVRMLQKGIPIQFVSDHHDTSPEMIRQHYAKWIPADLHDQATRGALIDLGAPVTGNVVPLTR